MVSIFSAAQKPESTSAQLSHKKAGWISHPEKLQEMIPIRAYSLKDLLRIYRVSRKTMYNWMKNLKEDPQFEYRKKQAIYTPKQVQMIFQKLGEPEY